MGELIRRCARCVCVGRVGVYRRCRYIVGAHGRRGESCGRIDSPVHQRCVQDIVQGIVGANHVGEFIRRYSPIGVCRGESCGRIDSPVRPKVCAGHSRGESCGRIYSPLFAQRVCVGANHVGEFIRRYTPDACASVGPGYIVGVDTSLVPTGVCRGESCGRIDSPVYALTRKEDTRTPPTYDIWEGQ